MANENNKAYGAKVLGEMVGQTMEWFDTAGAKGTVNECVQLSQKLVKSLMEDDLTEVRTKDKSQMLAYVGKTLDQVARLVQFSAGGADSRQEVSLASLLPLLSEDEMVIFDRALARLTAVDTGANQQSVRH
jgi:hypothetical protein